VRKPGLKGLKHWSREPGNRPGRGRDFSASYCYWDWLILLLTDWDWLILLLTDWDWLILTATATATATSAMWARQLLLLLLLKGLVLVVMGLWLKGLKGTIMGLLRQKGVWFHILVWEASGNWVLGKSEASLTFRSSWSFWAGSSDKHLDQLVTAMLVYDTWQSWVTIFKGHGWVKIKLILVARWGGGL